MNPIELFNLEKEENIKAQGNDNEAVEAGIQFIVKVNPYKYSYNFSWMGRPIIQFPQDIVAMQELIWQIQPDLIIETGIAHGGSLIFYASMMELVGKGEVLGIDIDIRSHNKEEIEKHPMSKRIKMIQGSSIDHDVFKKVKEEAEGKKTILVVLDSNHTHQHVLDELKLYAPLVTPGSYLVVFDTIVEDVPDELFADRPWGKGNNPKTAVWEFLKGNSDFTIDAAIHNKLLITVAPDGYLKRIR
jgi:cephalosporin hydroxylase